MTPHDEYILEKIKQLQKPIHIQNEKFAGVETATEVIFIQDRARREHLTNLITQIYEDGYRDGYDERQALGDLEPPKGGNYPN
jgi:hypothetical protein